MNPTEMNETKVEEIRKAWATETAIAALRALLSLARALCHLRAAGSG